jgi:hypothetical protein
MTFRLKDRQEKSSVIGAGDGTFDTPGRTVFMNDHMSDERPLCTIAWDGYAGNILVPLTCVNVYEEFWPRLSACAV